MNVALLLLLPLHYTSTGDLTGCARRIQICPPRALGIACRHVSTRAPSTCQLVRRPRVRSMQLKRRLLEKEGWAVVCVDKEREWDACRDADSRVRAMREMLAPFLPIRG